MSDVAGAENAVEVVFETHDIEQVLQAVLLLAGRDIALHARIPKLLYDGENFFILGALAREPVFEKVIYAALPVPFHQVRRELLLQVCFSHRAGFEIVLEELQHGFHRNIVLLRESLAEEAFASDDDDAVKIEQSCFDWGGVHVGLQMFDYMDNEILISK